MNFPELPSATSFMLNTLGETAGYENLNTEEGIMSKLKIECSICGKPFEGPIGVHIRSQHGEEDKGIGD